MLFVWKAKNKVLSYVCTSRSHLFNNFQDADFIGIKIITRMAAADFSLRVHVYNNGNSFLARNNNSQAKAWGYHYIGGKHLLGANFSLHLPYFEYEPSRKQDPNICFTEREKSNSMYHSQENWRLRECNQIKIFLSGCRRKCGDSV
jgi:hypothetical protein